jgi:hypothetical protein
MMQRIGVSGRQLRTFLANEAIALGWALRDRQTIGSKVSAAMRFEPLL